MNGCPGPVWPCAMTGAVAFLSGFKGLAIVIHGPSGCFYYPASLVGGDLHGTFMKSDEVVFGSTERVHEVVAPLLRTHTGVAIVTTCTPSVSGDQVDLAGCEGVIIIDSPGFSGGFQKGFVTAQEILLPRFTAREQGVTLDGLNPAEPWYRGNLIESMRLMALARVPVHGMISAGEFASSIPSGRVSVTANPDLASRTGVPCGSLLGLPAARKTFEALAERFFESDVATALEEIDRADERVQAACDKFLRRYDPPVAAVFGPPAYAGFASAALKRYLDAEIACTGLREEAPPWEKSPESAVCTDLEEISGVIGACSPDLVVGSSFERALAPQAAFAGLTFPLRGQVLLRSRPLAGTEGLLSFMDEVLNSCHDRARKGTLSPM